MDLRQPCGVRKLAPEYSFLAPRIGRGHCKKSQVTIPDSRRRGVLRKRNGASRPVIKHCRIAVLLTLTGVLALFGLHLFSGIRRKASGRVIACEELPTCLKNF
jgi:hypothetical protein